MEETRQIIQDASAIERLEAFDGFCEEINSKKCVACKHDLIEDRNIEFVCAIGVGNSEYGDFINNPEEFFCCSFEKK